MDHGVEGAERRGVRGIIGAGVTTMESGLWSSGMVAGISELRWLTDCVTVDQKFFTSMNVVVVECEEIDVGGCHKDAGRH